MTDRYPAPSVTIIGGHPGLQSNTTRSLYLIFLSACASIWHLAAITGTLHKYLLFKQKNETKNNKRKQNLWRGIAPPACEMICWWRWQAVLIVLGGRQECHHSCRRERLRMLYWCLHLSGLQLWAGQRLWSSVRGRPHWKYRNEVWGRTKVRKSWPAISKKKCNETGFRLFLLFWPQWVSTSRQCTYKDSSTPWPWWALNGSKHV